MKKKVVTVIKGRHGLKIERPTYFSIRTQVLRWNLKRDTKACLLSQLLGKVVGLSNKPVGTKDILAKLGETSFEGFISVKLNKKVTESGK